MKMKLIELILLLCIKYIYHCWCDNVDEKDSQVLTERMTKEERCYTAKREDGICTHIKQCPVLYNLMKTSRHNRTVSNYLISSVCKYERNYPIICCPTGEQDSVLNDTLSALLPDPPVCGVPQLSDHSRIVGGSPATLGSWPWLVAIGYKMRRRYSSDISYRCGGVLITNSFVLSAAHCDDKSNQMAQVRLGVIKLDFKKGDNPSPVDLPILKIISYDFNEYTYYGDIILLKIPKVQFTSYIKPICLPKTKELLANTFVGEDIYVAGWGTLGFSMLPSKVLMEVKLPVLSNAVCQQSYKSLMLLTASHMCAGFMQGGKDACQGDSGGPMMYVSDSAVYTIGVISLGYKCAEPGYPGIYTRVAAFMNWILENIDKNK